MTQGQRQRLDRLEGRTGTDTGRLFVRLINACSGAEWLGDGPGPDGPGPRDRVLELEFVAAENGRPKER